MTDQPSTPARNARRADLRWLKNADHVKEYERFDDETGEREAVWLMKSRSSPEARFYGVGRGQVGDKHQSVVAATYWAYGSGYLGVCADPSDIFLEIACRREVMSGGSGEPGPIRVGESACQHSV